MATDTDVGPTILDHLSRFPQEMAIIGRLVVGYGELEIALWRSLSVAVGSDSEATRIMFQRLGATARVNVVEAALRAHFEACGLGLDLTAAIKALHRCREIRNRYAHAYWDGAGSYLRSAPLEKAAEGKGDIDEMLSPIPLELLREQEERFIRCRDELLSLHDKFRAAK